MGNAEGFAGLFDFFYLPVDLKSQVCLEKFHGYRNWSIPSQKVCSVTWSGPHQGLHAHVKRYKNSPLMHSSIPEDYKPMMFVNGCRVPFKAPTKKGIRAPPVRNTK